MVENSHERIRSKTRPVYRVDPLRLRISSTGVSFRPGEPFVYARSLRSVFMYFFLTYHYTRIDIIYSIKSVFVGIQQFTSRPQWRYIHFSFLAISPTPSKRYPTHHNVFSNTYDNLTKWCLGPTRSKPEVEVATKIHQAAPIQATAFTPYLELDCDPGIPILNILLDQGAQVPLSLNQAVRVGRGPCLAAELVQVYENRLWASLLQYILTWASD